MAANNPPGGGSNQQRSGPLTAAHDTGDKGAPAAQQVDPRLTRAAKADEPGKTIAVAGYDEEGTAREFNLLPKEGLPDGYRDAPPKGMHPNSRK